MGFVLKISKKGYDVLKPDTPRSEKNPVESKLPHLMYAVAITYLDGASTQLKRYQEAATAQSKDDVMTTYRTLHELSNLFEDLGALAKYTGLCGHPHELSSLLIDIRNHIRHDLRDNFDEDIAQRKRAETLGIREAYQAEFSFGVDAVSVGSTIITAADIVNYLAWAANAINDVMAEAYEKGYTKSINIK